MTPQTEVLEQEELLEFARFAGPGTRLYPSPRPDEAKDLALPAMRWVQIDPIYKKSGIFARDRKNKVFETIQSGSSPDDLDLTIDPQYDNFLSADQKELIRTIALSAETPIPKEYMLAVEIGNLINDSGQAVNQNVSVTLDYVRTRQRPFLLALQGVEQRYQKRKTLLGVIKKQLARIEGLPGK